MQLFYEQHLNQLGQIVDLDMQESIHLTKVLRKKIGDVIMITNGKNQLFDAEIIAINKKSTSLKAISKIEHAAEKNNLTIVIAPTKNLARIEWFVEKSVEIGIDAIYFFISQNSERRNFTIERLQLKAISAMKQSLRTKLPDMIDLGSYTDALKANWSAFDQKYIAHIDENQIDMASAVNTKLNTIVWIGPEGGFTQKEVEKAKQIQFKPVSLGKNRLRTETAGIYAVSLFSVLKSKE